jgi:hypothetical protein
LDWSPIVPHFELLVTLGITVGVVGRIEGGFGDIVGGFDIVVRWTFPLGITCLEGAEWTALGVVVGAVVRVVVLFLGAGFDEVVVILSIGHWLLITTGGIEWVVLGGARTGRCGRELGAEVLPKEIDRGEGGVTEVTVWSWGRSGLTACVEWRCFVFRVRVGLVVVVVVVVDGWVVVRWSMRGGSGIGVTSTNVGIGLTNAKVRRITAVVSKPNRATRLATGTFFLCLPPMTHYLLTVSRQNVPPSGKS